VVKHVAAIVNQAATKPGASGSWAADEPSPQSQSMCWMGYAPNSVVPTRTEHTSTRASFSVCDAMRLSPYSSKNLRCLLPVLRRALHGLAAVTRRPVDHAGHAILEQRDPFRAGSRAGFREIAAGGHIEHMRNRDAQWRLPVATKPPPQAGPRIPCAAARMPPSLDRRSWPFEVEYRR